MNSKSKRRTVEGCFRLDVATFMRNGVLESLPGTSGVLYLPGREYILLSLVPYELVEPAPGRLGLRLEYLNFTGAGGAALLDHVIELEHTPCHFGGFRRWFLCPEANCGARCRTLYRPQMEPMFACRGCHGLIYQSQSRRDKVYLDYVRPRKQLKRIRDRSKRAGNDEDRKQLEAQAQVLEQRLEDFQTWVRELRWEIGFGRPVPAWKRRAVERASAFFFDPGKGSEDSVRLSYEVGSVFTPDQLLADRA